MQDGSGKGKEGSGKREEGEEGDISERRAAEAGAMGRINWGQPWQLQVKL